jgi:hypothetical protein
MISVLLIGRTCERQQTLVGHNVVPSFSRHWFGHVKIPVLRSKRGLKNRATRSALIRVVSGEWFVALKPNPSDRRFRGLSQMISSLLAILSAKSVPSVVKKLNWCPRPELNRDHTFRKRVLYPFELRGRQ